MIEILIALFVAFVVFWTLLAYGGEGKEWSAWPMFLLFFVAILPVGLWLAPVGPPLVGVYWVPFLFVAVFIAQFWAFSAPIPPRRMECRSAETSAPIKPDDASADPAGLGAVFWLLLVGLSIVALFRYATSGAVAQAS
ncbi:MAG TPA: hypothetical protein VLE46_17965 [Nitrospira sp.]|nr:hypothetical protein [Nitrospira sp.]